MYRSDVRHHRAYKVVPALMVTTDLPAIATAAIPVRSVKLISTNALLHRVPTAVHVWMVSRVSPAYVLVASPDRRVQPTSTSELARRGWTVIFVLG